MEKIYNNFAGMDLDTSPEKFNPNYYSTAYNVTIGSNIGTIPDSPSNNNKGSLEGIKNIGGVLSSIFTNPTNKIIALTKVRDFLVFIVSKDTTQAIYKVLETDLNNTSNLTPFFSWNKSDLTLNEDNTTILGRYETDKLIKVYITDGDTYLKSINLAGTPPTNVKQLEVFKPIEITTSPSFTIVTGGSLKAGNVAYGIQYYSLNGSATNYIPVGPILPVLKGDITDSKVLTGGALNEPTDKAASIIIPAISTTSRLNYAKVVRIHYSILGELPSITTIYDGAVSSTADTTVLDTGQFIESITNEEYAIVLNPFKCKTIEQKNNILFAGNILQSDFSVDYDARIKRYNYYQNGSPSIPYSGDYNPYNNPNQSNFPDTENCYTWQSDGHTVGGTGVNGSYIVLRTNIPIYDTISKKSLYNTNIYKKSFQRGEIYGFALVGFDQYMRPTFAKFIDDIKMPGYAENIQSREEFPRALNDLVLNTVRQEAVYVNFGFDNLPDSVKYCAVVRTSREGGDGTIVDMGSLAPIWNRPSPNEKRFNYCNNTTKTTFLSTSESAAGYYELVTPKLLVNGSLPKFDKIEYFYSNLGTYKEGNLNRIFVQADQRGITDKYYTETYACDSVINSVDSDTCADKQYFANNSNNNALLQIGSETLISWLIFPESSNYRGFKGRCGVVQFNTPITGVLPSGTTVKTPICVLKNTTYPYGGYTPVAIEQRSWILSSDITRVVNGSVNLSTNGWGDTYSQMSPYTRVLWNVVRSNWGDDVNAGNTCYLPFESQVLMKGVAGKTFDNYFSAGVDVTLQPFKLIQEGKGVWTDDSNELSLNSFTQPNDLYNYNSAYSANNKSKVYITKPAIYQPQEVFDCLVKSSERKINGELIDSWTIFKPNNRIELDTSRGSLTGLVNLNNTLFFIQEAGAGTLSVDERELISSSNTGNLQLGTGGVLTRFDYIYTNYGARNANEITNTNNFIYFYDNNSGKFCRMNTQDATILSDVMNCRNYFNTVLFNNNPSTNHVIGADNLRQTIYFKPSNADGIIFNELWNTFTSLHTIPFNNIFTTDGIMYFTIPYQTLTPFTGTSRFLYGLFPYANPDTSQADQDNLEHSLNKSVEFIVANPIPTRLDLIEWTSKNYTLLSNTDIEEKYEVYKEDILFKEFLDSNSNPNPRYFNKKRYNKIYNVNTRERCKGNYFKIKYIGNPDKLKKSNFTLNSFNVYVTPLLNR
ncbi:MAG: hypothetical protein ACRCXT_22080 [Paraclostridium sp.]